jgi:hypothetical protein
LNFLISIRQFLANQKTNSDRFKKNPSNFGQVCKPLGDTSWQRAPAGEGCAQRSAVLAYDTLRNTQALVSYQPFCFQGRKP